MERERERVSFFSTEGEGRAILSPSPVFGINRGSVTLEGIFNRGFLEGPVRGIDEKGNLLFIGLYYKGKVNSSISQQ